MTDYTELRKTLQEHLDWHGARLSFLALFLLALIKVKTVNLSELALGFGGQALSESHYKRLQRFFRHFELDYTEIAQVVVHWMQIPQPWVLSIDRTTWEFGTRCYNILTLGIVHEGVAFPVLWWMMEKKGNSNSDERMRMLEAFVKLFPHAEVRCLCGDREFVGASWLRYLLLEPAIPFRLRIRASDKIERSGTALAAKVVFAHLSVGTSQRLQGPCQVWGLT
ncbi:MAG: IS4 family transposase, partial [Cyanobacteria bacterium P01_E01_bin.43]